LKESFLVYLEKVKNCFLLGFSNRFKKFSIVEIVDNRKFCFIGYMMIPSLLVKVTGTLFCLGQGFPNKESVKEIPPVVKISSWPNKRSGETGNPGLFPIVIFWVQRRQLGEGAGLGIPFCRFSTQGTPR
jgi:hypothetical protein